MNGETLVAQMKRLGDVTKVKDIKHLTNAMFPGTHCPLMGAMMAVRGIKNAIMLTLGTDECAFYTKKTTIGSKQFGGLMGRNLSIIIDRHDITFGCKEKLETGFAEMMEEYHPDIVFVVTTCLIELIGDDIDSIVDELSAKHGVPSLVVHTEHFKTENHMPGVRDVITACAKLVEPTERTNAVNVIGQRSGDFSSTELYRALCEAGVKIGMSLPSGCEFDDIKRASGASVNIVVNPIGLPFAKEMEKRFGTPYVAFDKYSDPDNIMRAYENLFGCLNLPLPEKLRSLRDEAKQIASDAMNELDGLTYIYGNTPLDIFEFNAFLVKLGLVPQLIQTAELPENDENVAAILSRHNPYVTKTANIAPLQYVYDTLKPNLYFGHEFAQRLRAKGIEMVHADVVSDLLGFEVTLTIIRELLRAGTAARELRQDGNARESRENRRPA